MVRCNIQNYKHHDIINNKINAMEAVSNNIIMLLIYKTPMEKHTVFGDHDENKDDFIGKLIRYILLQSYRILL